jgi:ZIP family zinc transporter
MTDSLVTSLYDLWKPENARAFSLSFWASMGTFLGGVLVVFLIGILGADPHSPRTSKLMGILQSLSGGVMIHMTAFHLIPESAESVGMKETMVYFFIGVILFGILEHLILPDDGHEEESSPKKKTRSKSKQKPEEPQGIANISKKDAMELYRTSLITFIAMALHNIPEGISVYLASLSNPKMVNTNVELILGVPISSCSSSS